jgi:hypothetical protein
MLKILGLDADVRISLEDTKINDGVQSSDAFVDEREFELTQNFKKIDPYEVFKAVS